MTGGRKGGGRGEGRFRSKVNKGDSGKDVFVEGGARRGNEDRVTSRVEEGDSGSGVVFTDKKGKIPGFQKGGIRVGKEVSVGGGRGRSGGWGKARGRGGRGRDIHGIKDGGRRRGRLRLRFFWGGGGMGGAALHGDRGV